MTTTKLALRTYTCPVCKTESQTTTNHDGLIYSGCKTCGEGTLFPQKLVTQLDMWMHNGLNPDDLPVVELHHYYYDVSKEDQRVAYARLATTLEDLGFDKKDWLAERGTGGFAHARLSKVTHAMVSSVAGEYTLEQFQEPDAQLLTSAGRLFWWREFMVPNQNLRIGYYLSVSSIDAVQGTK